MKSVAAAVSLLAATTLALAVPSRKRADITDTDILNYALTLEHLEANFYAGALAKFDNASFAAVNADRGRFQEIADHETQHVAFLTGALGNSATAACNYSFPYTDVTSFVALAAVLESVGVSAYLGAASLITTPAYLTAAGSILTTEARHQAYISYVSGSAPWSGPEDTPLSLDDIYSLAAPFITSCPSSNPTLPVKAFPALNITSSNNTAGSQLTFSYAASSNSSTPAYIAFFSGLTNQAVAIKNGSNTVTIPSGLNGTVFAVVTTSANGTATDTNTLAGPAILSLGGLSVDGGSNGTGVLNNTNSGGNGTSGGSGGSGGSNHGSGGAVAIGAKGASVVAGLMLAGLAAVLF